MTRPVGPGTVSFDFAGRRVLVTGASRGIGLGVAEGFVAAGADVTILASGNEVEETARMLAGRHGREVGAIVCDITNQDGVDAALAPFERIDVLVNNAGLELVTPLTDRSEETISVFERIVEINVLGTYHVTRTALTRMGPGGRIIITSSMWGKTAVAEFSAYCSSKHANIGFMRSLAMELGPRGISVNAVCPGWVRTAASMRSLAIMASRSGGKESELLDEIVDAQAIGGLMEPEDMAMTYLFLASDAASNITGQAISVDRGDFIG
ncbi:MAG: SDR family NAD(P)-dependent oxidoreductase [bacterium]|nr:SDR family NAD(P)-dependent oxidoreductase [bacterium]